MTLTQINEINGCELANEIGQANSGMRDFDSLRKSKREDTKSEVLNYTPKRRIFKKFI